MQETTTTDGRSPHVSAADAIAEAHALCASVRYTIEAAPTCGTELGEREYEGLAYVMARVCDLLDTARGLTQAPPRVTRG